MERTYEHQANAYGKATLVANLDAHGEASYERSANARDEATR